jgi:hypothetical protein
MCSQLALSIKVLEKLTQSKNAFRRAVGAGCAVVLCLLGTFAYSQSATVPGPMSLRTQEAGWAQGNKLASEFERYSSLITDSTVTEYMNLLEERIVRDSRGNALCREGCQRW